MSDDPELPTFLQHRSAVYGVLPDVHDHTWSVWDDVAWIGNIVLGADWSSAQPDGRIGGPHQTWQAAVGALVDARSDLPAHEL